jgi:hypothetical protein
MGCRLTSVSSTAAGLGEASGTGSFGSWSVVDSTCRRHPGPYPTCRGDPHGADRRSCGPVRRRPEREGCRGLHPGTDATRQGRATPSTSIRAMRRSSCMLARQVRSTSPSSRFEVFRQLLDLEPNARLLVLTSKMNHGRFRDLASELPPRASSSGGRPTDVPGLLAACDVGLAFRTPSFSQRAVAPIKVAEYLLVRPACCLPSRSRRPRQHPRRTGGVRCQRARPMPTASDVADWIMHDVLPRRSELRDAARSLG